jgi:hypothetical protein
MEKSDDEADNEVSTITKKQKLAKQRDLAEQQ